MNRPSDAEILEELIQLVEQLSSEWAYAGPVTAETRLIADMNLRSLDLVIISSAIVKRFGRMPFDVFYSEISERPPEEREVTIGELAAFVSRNLPPVSISA